MGPVSRPPANYVLLVPVVEDMTVDVEWGQDDLNIMSFAATGIGHPAVMSLAPNWDGISEPTVFQDDAGAWALGYPWESGLTLGFSRRRRRTQFAATRFFAVGDTDDTGSMRTRLRLVYCESGAPLPGPARRFAPDSKLPCAPQAHCGEFRFLVVNFVKGGR